MAAIMSLSLILGLLISLSLDFTVGQIGVNYGTVASRLPPPWKVVSLYHWYGIKRMRIYDTNPRTLGALCGSNIELTVGVVHRDLEDIAASPDAARAWVRDNICKYPDVDFRHIIVGNEISPIKEKTSKFAPFVLPAMQNMHDAISEAGLDDRIQISTSIDTGILSPSRYPEEGVFRPEVAPYIDPIIRFLNDTEAPIFASIYPYFAYINDPKNIDLRYALLDPTYEGVVMPNGVRYQNLFYAIVDTVYTAVERSLAASASVSTEADIDISASLKVKVKGGESGHPSFGNINKKLLGSYYHGDVATIENARKYINNLIRVVKSGTPKRPDEAIETYIFAMFDENQKPGEETERHFGLFNPNGRPKYRVNFH